MNLSENLSKYGKIWIPFCPYTKRNRSEKAHKISTTCAQQPYFIAPITSIDVSRVFLSRPVHTSNPRRQYHGWRQTGKFSKFVPPNALKMHSLALSVLRFLCKPFSKLLKLALRKALFRR